jgi:prevent-host-death family protein
VHNEHSHIGVRDLRANLSGLLRKVRQGATIVVMSRGQPVAELRPPLGAKASPRKPGALKGRIRLAPNFDNLPADILESIEK